RTARVVLAKRHEHQIRHGAIAIHLLEFFDEPIGADDVSLALQSRFDWRLLEARAADRGNAATVAHAVGPGLASAVDRKFPDVRRRLLGDAAFGVEAAVARIAQRPGTLRKFVRIR